LITKNGYFPISYYGDYENIFVFSIEKTNDYKKKTKNVYWNFSFIYISTGILNLHLKLKKNQITIREITGSGNLQIISISSK